MSESRMTPPSEWAQDLARKRQEARRHRGGWRIVAIWVAGILAGLGLGLAGGLGAVAWAWQRHDIVSQESILSFRPKEGSVVLADGGEEIATFSDEDRRMVTLGSLPKHVAQAFMAIEDRRFYSHGAVDWPRIPGAIWANIRHGHVREGSSTITMQLARNTFPELLPARDRSMGRKIREILVAREMERYLTKNDILERYLNTIYLGRGAYGIERGAETYFGVRAESLTVAQSAMLAALPKAPSSSNPVVNPGAAVARRNLVLQRMAAAGFITGVEARAAQAESLGVRPHAMAGMAYRTMTAPYFVDAVRGELAQILGERLYVGGLRVYTTLDLGIEKSTEASLKAATDSMSSVKKPVEGAAIFMDTRNGDVLAMVGGRSWDSSRFNRATQEHRPMGSSFKPIVYAAAIADGRGPYSEISDDPIAIPMSDGSIWEPRSYESHDDGGLVTLERALALSKNRATVRLAMAIGLDRVREVARRLGMEKSMPQGPAAVLGSGSSNPLDVAHAYSAFVRGGSRVVPRYVVKVLGPDGSLIWQRPVQAEDGIDSTTAGIVRTMMTSVVTWGTAAGVRAIYKGAAAGKTGTTNESRDLWFVGMSPGRIGVVWLGTDADEPLERGSTGGRWAAPVWARVMAQYPDTGHWPSVRMPQSVDTSLTPLSTDTITDSLNRSPEKLDSMPGPGDTTLSVDSLMPARGSGARKRRRGIMPIQPSDSGTAGRPEDNIN